MKDARALLKHPSDLSSSEEQTGPESDFREPFLWPHRLVSGVALQSFVFSTRVQIRKA